MVIKIYIITTATQPPELVVLVFQPQTFEYTDNSGLFVNGDIENIELRIGNTQKYPDKPLPINATEFFYQDQYINSILTHAKYMETNRCYRIMNL